MLSFPTMYLTRVYDNFFKIPIFTGVPAYAGVRSRRRPNKNFFSSKCPEMNFRKSYKSWGPYHIPFISSGVQCTPEGHFDTPPSPGRVKDYMSFKFLFDFRNRIQLMYSIVLRFSDWASGECSIRLSSHSLSLCHWNEVEILSNWLTVQTVFYK